MTQPSPLVPDCPGSAPEKQPDSFLHVLQIADYNASKRHAWATSSDVRALDVAKRRMDYNFHPPTNYFPLIVHEALMIEPTETENKDTLDAFVDAMLKIAEEAKTQPEILHRAPHTTLFGRMDEVKAARELVLCCWLPEEYQ